MSENTKIALLEQSIGHINETMLRIEKRFDLIDKRFDRIDQRFDKVDQHFDRVDQRFLVLDAKLDSNFKWLLGMIVGSFAGILGVIGHAQHWI